MERQFTPQKQTNQNPFSKTKTLFKMPSASKMYVVLPMFGSPYVLKTPFTGKSDLQNLQGLVGGYIEAIHSGRKLDKEQIVIHPLFTMDCSRWNIADTLLKQIQRGRVKGEVYCNENGLHACSPNMGVIDRRSGMNIFGAVVIFITTKQLDKAKENWRDILPIFETEKDRVVYEENLANYESDEDEDEQTPEEKLVEKLTKERKETKEFLKMIEKTDVSEKIKKSA